MIARKSFSPNEARKAGIRPVRSSGRAAPRGRLSIVAACLLTHSHAYAYVIGRHGFSPNETLDTGVRTERTICCRRAGAVRPDFRYASFRVRCRPRLDPEAARHARRYGVRILDRQANACVSAADSRGQRLRNVSSLVRHLNVPEDGLGSGIGPPHLNSWRDLRCHPSRHAGRRSGPVSTSRIGRGRGKRDRQSDRNEEHLRRFHNHLTTSLHRADSHLLPAPL